MDLEKIVLPELGEGVEEAKVLKIRKKIGDTVRKNEVVAEVATDKVDSEIEAQVDGIVTHLACQEGEMVKVGQTILSLKSIGDEAVRSGEQISDVRPNQEEFSLSQPIANTSQNNAAYVANQPNYSSNSPVVSDANKANSDSQQDTFLSPLVSSMIAQHGISQQELASIQGTGNNGRVRKGDIIQFLEQRDKEQLNPEPKPATTNYSTNSQSEAKPELNNSQSNPQIAISPKPQEAQSIKSSIEFPENPQSSPAFLSQTATTAPLEQAKERILDKEIPSAKSHHTKQGFSFYENSYAAIDRDSYDEFFETKPKDSVEIVAMSRMRSVIAEHMRTSLDTSAHATLFGEVDVTAMVKWREGEKHKFVQKNAEKLTYTHLVTWIVAQVLPQFPLLNSSIDKKNIILKKNINLGIATALPTGDLIVPVIKNADQLSFLALVQECNNLTQKARDNRLKFTDIEGGTFTISSIGSFGILHGTPIIQQPQVAILVAGAIKSKPAVHKYEGQTIIVAREIMHLSLGFDHRIIDGMLAGNFLKACSEKLENFIPPDID